MKGTFEIALLVSIFQAEFVSLSESAKSAFSSKFIFLIYSQAIIKVISHMDAHWTD